VFEYLNLVDPYLFSFFQAFLFTFSVEVLVLLLLAKKIQTFRIFNAVLIGNLVSMLIVWFLFSVFIREFHIYLFTSELFAVFSESVILKMFLSISYRRSLFYSLVANFFSFSIGWILSILFFF
jgi:hypothetical protein